jgi:tetratricopeptide (TPR) repeat protein
MDKSTHVTEQQVDDLYLRMHKSNKKSLTASWLIYVLIFILLIALFAGAISSLNEELTTQIIANDKLVNRLDIIIVANDKLVNRLDTIEKEMKIIRNNIYSKGDVSVKEVRQQLVSDVIAREVNRRTSPEQQKMLEAYQENEDYNELKDNIYFLTKAVRLSSKDELTKALKAVEQSINLNNNISTPYSVMSEILAKQKKLKQATIAQTKAISIESKLPFSEVLPNYYNTRGFLYIKQDKFDQALADFRKGSNIAEGEEKSFILENAVLVDLYLGKWEDAFVLSTELIEFNVDGGWYWFLRAIAADKLNNKEDEKIAIDNWNKNIEADPNPDSIASLKASLENTNLSSYQEWL